MVKITVNSDEISRLRLIRKYRDFRHKLNRVLDAIVAHGDEELIKQAKVITKEKL